MAVRSTNTMRPRQTLLLFDPLNSPLKPLSSFQEQDEHDDDDESHLNLSSGFLVDVDSPSKQGALIGDLVGDFSDLQVSQMSANEVDSFLISLDSPVQPKRTVPQHRPLGTPTRNRVNHLDSPSTPATVVRPSRLNHRFQPALCTPVGPRTLFAFKDTEETPKHSALAINPSDVALPSSPPSELSVFLSSRDVSLSPPRPTVPTVCAPSPDAYDTHSSFILDTPRPTRSTHIPDLSFNLLADTSLPDGLSMSTSTFRAPSPTLLSPYEFTEGSSFIMKSPSTARSPAPKKPAHSTRSQTPLPDTSFDLLSEALHEMEMPPETSFALPTPTPRPSPSMRSLLGTPSQATPTGRPRKQADATSSRLNPPSRSPPGLVPSGEEGDWGDTTLDLDAYFRDEGLSFCHLPGMELELDGGDDRWDVSFMGQDEGGLGAR